MKKESSTKKKVIIFTEKFADGGIEKIMSYINNNINKDLYDIKLLCTIKNTTLFDDNIISISSKKKLNILNKFFVTLFNISKYLKTTDIIHINIHSPIGLIYAFISKRKNNKVIVHAHNSGFDNDKYKIKIFLANVSKILFSRKDYIYISCSLAAKNFCFKKNVNCKVIKNNLDINNFIYDSILRKQIRNRYNISNNEFIIGNIGRLVPQKNQLFLIYIFKSLLKYNNNSKLFIVGTGPLKEELIKEIDKLKISDKVIFIDSYKKINELYMMFDVYVQPSLYEGYCITVMEALSSSLPCFISNNIKDNFDNNSDLHPISLNKKYDYWAKKIIENSKVKRVKCKLPSSTFIKEISDVYEK